MAKCLFERTTHLVRGNGLVVNMLAFYFDNPSSNPAVFCVCLSTKIMQKVAHFKKDYFQQIPLPFFRYSGTEQQGREDVRLLRGRVLQRR